jgi:hypothetical protein
MESATISSSSRIAPYSPEWFMLRQGCFTGSEAYKLMTDPRGKSPLQKFEEHALKLAEMEAKYQAIPEAKLIQKASINLKTKIEASLVQYKILHEKKNDFHISDTAETYILQKVHEKLTGQIKQGIDNFATQWGVENEPKAKYWYSQITGRILLEPFLEFHPVIEGFSCTPDAPIDPEGLCEIKCPFNGENHLKHWLISSDEYLKEKHDDHYWQMMSQMEIMEQPFCDFVSFDPRINNDRGMFIYNLQYNEQDAALLRDRVIIARSLFNDYYNLFSQAVA